jgi:hypothetical protein
MIAPEIGGPESIAKAIIVKYIPILLPTSPSLPKLMAGLGITDTNPPQKNP